MRESKIGPLNRNDSHARTHTSTRKRTRVYYAHFISFNWIIVDNKIKYNKSKSLQQKHKKQYKTHTTN